MLAIIFSIYFGGRGRGAWELAITFVKPHSYQLHLFLPFSDKLARCRTIVSLCQQLTSIPQPQLEQTGFSHRRQNQNNCDWSWFAGKLVHNGRSGKRCIFSHNTVSVRVYGLGGVWAADLRFDKFAYVPLLLALHAFPRSLLAAGLPLFVWLLLVSFWSISSAQKPWTCTPSFRMCSSALAHWDFLFPHLLNRSWQKSWINFGSKCVLFHCKMNMNIYISKYI